MENKINESQNLKHKVFSIIGIVLCALLLPILIINITMIISSYTNKDDVPSFGKYVPFIIQSGSMSGTIEGGDIIVTKRVDAQDIKVDDIITFYDPKGNGTTTVTHRVLDIDNSGEKIIFKTVGDVVLNDNIKKYESFEKIPQEVLNSIVEIVPEDKVISIYKFRIPLIGHVSLFMSTIPGFIVCVLVPLLLLVGYDVVRRKIYDNANKADTDALMQELEQLRAEKAQNQNDSNEENE